MTPLLQAAVHRHNSADAATAEVLFRAAIAEQPQDHQAWQLLAAHLLLRECYETAEACAEQAAALEPQSADAWATLGIVRHRRELYPAALAAHDQALRLRPVFAAALRNRGMTCYALNRLDDAVADFEAARSILGEDKGLLADMAWPVLASGDYERGFALAESRTVKPSCIWDFAIPLWRGEPLAGKTLIVHHEQGFGDTIMWARYLPRLAAKAARVVVAVHFGLLRLFRNAFAGDVRVIPLPGEIPPADYQVPFDSLPYLLGVVDEDGSPYIPPPPYKALLPVNSGTRLRVGIAWSSGRQLLYGRQRSMPFAKILSLTRIPGVQLYSLNPEGTADIAAAGAGALVTDMAPMIRDWADTAAIIDKLDLVATVDTALLHLAGAMGNRTIGLISYCPAWQHHPRWQSQSRWYRSVELLFQSAPQEWDAQIAQLCAIIAEIVA